MMLKANRFASAIAVCAAMVILWSEGCSSSKSDLPAGSIVGESAQNAPSADTQVQHQPTILRAEIASPPISGLISDRLSETTLEPRLGDAIPSAAASPYIADLLPIPSQDAPPSQR